MPKTRKLGKTEIEVTAIGYGCMGQTHAYGVVEAENDMILLMRYAYDVGYTFFDTAPVYGEANERYLGKAVEPFRKNIVIATKYAHGACHLLRRIISVGRIKYAKYRRLKICTHLWHDRMKKHIFRYARSWE